MLAEGVEFDRAEGTEYTTVVAYLCKDGIIIEGNCRLAQKWVGRFGKSDGTAFDPTQNKSMPFRYERINGLRIAEVQREPHLGNLPWHSAHDYAEYAAGRVAERTAGKRRDH
ncbi:hypothetical protein A5624_19935 [Mycobacterium sp. 1482292.6]|nr:hypothetical protein A5624_19935 [Mycobacterium sp. 1482292.6]